MAKHHRKSLSVVSTPISSSAALVVSRQSTTKTKHRKQRKTAPYIGTPELKFQNVLYDVILVKLFYLIYGNFSTQMYTRCLTISVYVVRLHIIITLCFIFLDLICYEFPDEKSVPKIGADFYLSGQSRRETRSAHLPEATFGPTVDCSIRLY